MADFREIMNPWRCRRFEAGLVDLANGTLPPAQQANVERHVATCARCAALLAALDKVPALLRELPQPSRDEDFWRRQRQDVMRAIRTRPAQRPRRILVPAFAWRAGLTAAAVVVIAVIGYRLVEWPSLTPPERFQIAASHLPKSIDALDNQTIAALTDVTAAVISTGELMPAGREPDASLLGSSGMVALAQGEPDDSTGKVGELALHELNDDELEQLDDLIGGLPS
jgi:anti-sigma factor RsiW